MPDGLTGRGVDPDLGIVLDRRICDEPDLVTVVELLHVSLAPREYDPVDRGPEVRGLSGRKGWRRSRHGHSARVAWWALGPTRLTYGSLQPRQTAPFCMSTAYLDHAATTPLRDDVVDAMAPYLSTTFGNPSSSHRWGREASAALEHARARVASALGARPGEVRFVRGGTESDNLAVIGGVRALASRAKATATPAEPAARPVILVSEIEHSAVLEPAGWLHERGEAEMRRVAVGPDGTLDLTSVSDGLGGRGSLISVMWVNNETGLLLPVDDVVHWAEGHATVVHTDASQALGKVPVDLRSSPVDLLTATGHKLGGPRGSGVLYVRDGVDVEPLIFGGGQERALRPGTEDVAGAVGLAVAIDCAVADLEPTARRMAERRDRLQARLIERIPGLRVNSVEGPRAPHVLSVGVPGIDDAAAFLMALDLEGVAASGGSACHSGATGGSHVIAALYGPDDPLATVRLSVGRGTTDTDVDRGVEAVATVWSRLRSDP